MQRLKWRVQVWMLTTLCGLMAVSCTPQTKNQRVMRTDLRPLTPPASPLPYQQPDTTLPATIQAAYAALPLHFEPNRGQTTDQVRFLCRGSGYTLFLTATEAVLSLGQEAKVGSGGLEPAAAGSVPLRMRLVGANPSPQVMGLEELPGKINYFIGNDSTRWRTGIPTYAGVPLQRPVRPD